MQELKICALKYQNGLLIILVPTEYQILFELKIIFMTRLCHPLFDSVSIRNVFRFVDTLFVRVKYRPLRRQKNTISFLLDGIDAR